ncbi:MAG: hypothetical protein V1662_00795, partial [Candidatus Omnitrophota bacterium]
SALEQPAIAALWKSYLTAEEIYQCKKELLAYKEINYTSREKFSVDELQRLLRKLQLLKRLGELRGADKQQISTLEKQMQEVERLIKERKLEQEIREIKAQRPTEKDDVRREILRQRLSWANIQLKSIRGDKTLTETYAGLDSTVNEAGKKKVDLPAWINVLEKYQASRAKLSALETEKARLEFNYALYSYLIVSKKPDYAALRPYMDEYKDEPEITLPGLKQAEGLALEELQDKAEQFRLELNVVQAKLNLKQAEEDKSRTKEAKQEAIEEAEKQLKRAELELKLHELKNKIKAAKSEEEARKYLSEIRKIAEELKKIDLIQAIFLEDGQSLDQTLLLENLQKAAGELGKDNSARGLLKDIEDKIAHGELITLETVRQITTKEPPTANPALPAGRRQPLTESEDILIYALTGYEPAWVRAFAQALDNLLGEEIPLVYLYSNTAAKQWINQMFPRVANLDWKEITLYVKALETIDTFFKIEHFGYSLITAEVSTENARGEIEHILSKIQAIAVDLSEEKKAYALSLFGDFAERGYHSAGLRLQLNLGELLNKGISVEEAQGYLREIVNKYGEIIETLTPFVSAVERLIELEKTLSQTANNGPDYLRLLAEKRQLQRYLAKALGKEGLVDISNISLEALIDQAINIADKKFNTLLETLAGKEVRDTYNTSLLGGAFIFLNAGYNFKTYDKPLGGSLMMTLYDAARKGKKELNKAIEEEYNAYRRFVLGDLNRNIAAAQAKAAKSLWKEKVYSHFKGMVEKIDIDKEKLLENARKGQKNEKPASPSTALESNSAAKQAQKTEQVTLPAFDQFINFADVKTVAEPDELAQLISKMRNGYGEFKDKAEELIKKILALSKEEKEIKVIIEAYSALFHTLTVLPQGYTRAGLIEQMKMSLSARGMRAEDAAKTARELQTARDTVVDTAVKIKIEQYAEVNEKDNDAADKRAQLEKEIRLMMREKGEDTFNFTAEDNASGEKLLEQKIREWKHVSVAADTNTDTGTGLAPVRNRIEEKPFRSFVYEEFSQSSVELQKELTEGKITFRQWAEKLFAVCREKALTEQALNERGRQLDKLTDEVIAGLLVKIGGKRAKEFNGDVSTAQARDALAVVIREKTGESLEKALQNTLAKYTVLDSEYSRNVQTLKAWWHLYHHVRPVCPPEKEALNDSKDMDAFIEHRIQQSNFTEYQEYLNCVKAHNEVELLKNKVAKKEGKGAYLNVMLGFVYLTATFRTAKEKDPNYREYENTYRQLTENVEKMARYTVYLEFLTDLQKSNDTDAEKITAAVKYCQQELWETALEIQYLKAQDSASLYKMALNNKHDTKWHFSIEPISFIILNVMQFLTDRLSSNKEEVKTQQNALMSEMDKFSNMLSQKRQEQVPGVGRINIRADEWFITTSGTLVRVVVSDDNKMYLIYQDTLHNVMMSREGNPAVTLSIDLPPAYAEIDNMDELLEKAREENLRLDTSYLIPLKTLEGKNGAAELVLRTAYSFVTPLGKYEPSYQALTMQAEGAENKGGVALTRSEDGNKYRLFMQKGRALGAYLEFDSEGYLTFAVDGRKVFNVSGNSSEVNLSYLYCVDTESSRPDDKSGSWQKLNLGYSQQYGLWQVKGLLKWEESQVQDEEPVLVIGTNVERRLGRNSVGVEVEKDLKDSDSGEYTLVVRRRGAGGIESFRGELTWNNQDKEYILRLTQRIQMGNSQVTLGGETGGEASYFEGGVNSADAKASVRLASEGRLLNKAQLEYLWFNRVTTRAQMLTNGDVRGGIEINLPGVSRNARTRVDSNQADFSPCGNIRLSGSRYNDVLTAIQRRLNTLRDYSLNKEDLEDILSDELDKISGNGFRKVMAFLEKDTELSAYLGGGRLNLTQPLHFWEVVYWYLRIQDDVQQGMNWEKAKSEIKEEIFRYNYFKDAVAHIAGKSGRDWNDAGMLSALQGVVKQTKGWDKLSLAKINIFLAGADSVRRKTTEGDHPLIPGEALDMTQTASWQFVFDWTVETGKWENAGFDSARMLGYLARLLNSQDVPRDFSSRAPPSVRAYIDVLQRLIREKLLDTAGWSNGTIALERFAAVYFCRDAKFCVSTNENERFYLAVEFARQNLPFDAANINKSINARNAVSADSAKEKALWIAWLSAHPQAQESISQFIAVKNYFAGLISPEPVSLDWDTLDCIYRWTRANALLSAKGHNIYEYFDTISASTYKNKPWELNWNTVKGSARRQNTFSRPGVRREQMTQSLHTAQGKIQPIDLNKGNQVLVKAVKQAVTEVKQEYNLAEFEGMNFWSRIQFKELPQGFSYVGASMDNGDNRIIYLNLPAFKANPAALVKTAKHELCAVLFGITHEDNVKLEQQITGHKLVDLSNNLTTQLNQARQLLKNDRFPALKDFADVKTIGDRLIVDPDSNRFWFNQPTVPQGGKATDFIYGVVAYNIDKNYTGTDYQKVDAYLAHLKKIIPLNNRLLRDYASLQAFRNLFGQDPRNAPPFAPDLVGLGDPECKDVYVPILFSIVAAKDYNEDKFFAALPDADALDKKMDSDYEAQRYLPALAGVTYVSDPSADTDAAGAYRKFLFDTVQGVNDIDEQGIPHYKYRDLADTPEKRAGYWVSDFTNAGWIWENCWNDIAVFHFASPGLSFDRSNKKHLQILYQEQTKVMDSKNPGRKKQYLVVYYDGTGTRHEEWKNADWERRGVDTFLSNAVRLVNNSWNKMYNFNPAIGYVYLAEEKQKQEIVSWEQVVLYPGRPAKYTAAMYDLLSGEWTVKELPRELKIEDVENDLTNLNTLIKPQSQGGTSEGLALYYSRGRSTTLDLNNAAVRGFVQIQMLQIKTDYRKKGESVWIDVDRLIARRKEAELKYNLQQTLEISRRRGELAQKTMPKFEKLYGFNRDENIYLAMQLPAYFEEQILIPGVREHGVGINLAMETEVDTIPLILTSIQDVDKLIDVAGQVKDSPIMEKIKQQWGLNGVVYCGNSEAMPGVISLETEYPVTKSSYFRQVIEDYAFMIFKQWYWYADNYERDAQIVQKTIPRDKQLDFAKWVKVMTVQMDIVGSKEEGLYDIIRRVNNLAGTAYRGDKLSVYARQVIADAARMIVDQTYYYYADPNAGINDYELKPFEKEFTLADLKESYLYAEALNAKLAENSDDVQLARDMIVEIWKLKYVQNNSQPKLGVDRAYDIFIYNTVGGRNAQFKYEYDVDAEGKKMSPQEAAQRYVETLVKVQRLRVILEAMTPEEKRLVEGAFNIDLSDGADAGEIMDLINIIYAQRQYDWDGDGAADYVHTYDEQKFVDTIKYMAVLIGEITKSENHAARELLETIAFTLTARVSGEAQWKTEQVKLIFPQSDPYSLGTTEEEKQSRFEVLASIVNGFNQETGWKYQEDYNGNKLTPEQAARDFVDFYTAARNFSAAYDTYTGDKAKVNDVLKVFKHPKEAGKYLDLSNGVQTEDIYILGYYNHNTEEGYGILHGEDGQLRDNNKNGKGGEIEDYAVTMQVYEAAYNFDAAYRAYSGDKQKVNKALNGFTVVLNEGKENQRTAALDLESGLDADDLYVLAYYDARTHKGYGLLHDEEGKLRDSNKNGVGGEIADYNETMKLLEVASNFYTAYDTYTGNKKKVNDVLGIFSLTLNDGTEYARTITLNLEDGLGADDLYILAYYDARTHKGYGLLHDEEGKLRDNNKDGRGGEIADYLMTMRVYEAVADFNTACKDFHGDREKVNRIISLFTCVLNKGTEFERTVTLNLEDGLDADDLYILLYYDAKTKEGYGLIHDEEGNIRENFSETIRFFEAVFGFIDKLREYSTGAVDYARIFRELYAYDKELDVSALTPRDLKLFALVMFNKDGKLKSEEKIEETLRLLPYVYTLVQGLGNGKIDRRNFIEWTKGRTDAQDASFELKEDTLPGRIVLNSQFYEESGTVSKKDVERFSTALFTLAKYMDYLLSELKTSGVNLGDFNRIYGLHSLKSDFTLNLEDSELAATLFMIVTGVGGDFIAEFDAVDYTRSIPDAAELVELIAGNPRYVQALDYFYKFNLHLGNKFSLNPENSNRLGRENFIELGKFIFGKAYLIKEGVYEDAEAVLEMIARVYDARAEIERKIGRNLNFGFTRIDFEYRVSGGTVTVFIYDGYDFKTRHINPVSAALYGITFIGEGASLNALENGFSHEAELIKHSTRVAAVSVREGMSEARNTVTVNKTFYLPNGEKYYSVRETYDALPYSKGYLLESERVDERTGNTLRTEYTYAPGEVIYYTRTMPVYVPTSAVSYLRTRSGVERKHSEFETLDVNRDAQTITQKITYYNPLGATTNEIIRSINFAGANLRGDAADGSAYIDYNNYDSAWLEFLNISARVTKYDYAGEPLEVTTFDARNGFTQSAGGLRMRKQTRDLVNGLEIERQVDTCGNADWQEARDTQRTIFRRVTYSYTNLLWAGFGQAEFANEQDIFTGLEVSRSRILGFNRQGGADIQQDLLIEGRSIIYTYREKGRLWRVYEGKDVRCAGGKISADTVTIYDYTNESGLTKDIRYWQARGIATLAEKWSWNNAVQGEGAFIHSSRPQEITDIVTHYGTFRVLRTAYEKPSLGMTMNTYISLANGKPVRFEMPNTNSVISGAPSVIPAKAGIQTVDVRFNSLGIESASRSVNASGREIETTKSYLDAQGRPLKVYDAAGNELPATLKKHYTKSDTGQEKDLIQNSWNGLTARILIKPAIAGKDITWQIDISYGENEVETEAHSLVYRGKTFIGERQYTLTLSAGEGRIHKVEYSPRTGEKRAYYQDAYTGLPDDIEIEVFINGRRLTCLVDNEYDDLNTIQSWTFYPDGEKGAWGYKVQLQKKDLLGKQLYLNYLWANGKRDTHIMDADSGLMHSVSIRVRPDENAGDILWMTLVQFDAFGTENGSGTYVDVNMDGRISGDEKQNHWVSRGKRISIDPARQLIELAYENADRTSGKMWINIPTGKEVEGTLTRIDMGRGVQETRRHQIIYGDDLRELYRENFDSEGNPVSESRSLPAAFSGPSMSLSGLTGQSRLEVSEETIFSDNRKIIRFIDPQGGFTREEKEENVEIVPGIEDTLSVNYNYTPRGIVKNSTAHSEALSGWYPRGTAYSETISSDGSLGLSFDRTHDGEKQFYRNNQLGLTLGQSGEYLAKENYYTRQGTLAGVLTKDRLSGRLLAVKDTVRYLPEQKSYYTSETWLDKNGRVEYTEQKWNSRWGKPWQALRTLADGEKRRIGYTYGQGGIENETQVYKLVETALGSEWLLHQKYGDYQWKDGVLDTRVDNYRKDTLLERRREKYSDSRKITETRGAIESILDYKNGYIAGQKDVLHEENGVSKTIGGTNEVTFESLPAKAKLLIKKHYGLELEHMRFFVRNARSPQGAEVKSLIEGFIPSEDMPVVRITHNQGFLEIALRDVYGIYASVKYDLDMPVPQAVAYGLFLDANTLLVLDWMKQTALIEVRDFDRSDLSKEYLNAYLMSKYTLSQSTESFTKQDVENVIAELAGKDYPRKKEIIENYIKDNFTYRAYLAMQYEDTVPYHPDYLEYMETAAKVATYPYLLTTGNFAAQPVETSALERLDSRNIVALRRINYRLPFDDHIYIRKSMDWLGRTEMSNYYDETNTPQMNAYSFFHPDSPWAKYDLGTNALVSVYDEDGREILYKASYLNADKVQPGRFEYDVVKGIFGEVQGDIYQEYKDKLYFKYEAVEKGEQEVKDGEGRLRVILSGFPVVNKTTGRPEGVPRYVSFLAYGFSSQAVLEVGPIHMGLSEEGRTYEYSPENGNVPDKYNSKKWLEKAHDFRFSITPEGRPIMLYDIAHNSTKGAKKVQTNRQRRPVTQEAFYIYGVPAYIVLEGKDGAKKVQLEYNKLGFPAGAYTLKDEMYIRRDKESYKKLYPIFDKNDPGRMRVYEVGDAGLADQIQKYFYEHPEWLPSGRNVPVYCEYYNGLALRKSDNGTITPYHQYYRFLERIKEGFSRIWNNFIGKFVRTTLEDVKLLIEKVTGRSENKLDREIKQAIKYDSGLNDKSRSQKEADKLVSVGILMAVALLAWIFAGFQRRIKGIHQVVTTVNGGGNGPRGGSKGPKDGEPKDKPDKENKDAQDKVNKENKVSSSCKQPGFLKSLLGIHHFKNEQNKKDTTPIHRNTTYHQLAEKLFTAANIDELIANIPEEFSEYKAVFTGLVNDGLISFEDIRGIQIELGETLRAAEELIEKGSVDASTVRERLLGFDVYRAMDKDKFELVAAEIAKGFILMNGHDYIYELYHYLVRKAYSGPTGFYCDIYKFSQNPDDFKSIGVSPDDAYLKQHQQKTPKYSFRQ